MNRANNDYSLQNNSPCIDAGLNQNWMTSAVDLAQNPRQPPGVFGKPVPAIVYIGAYEYTPRPSAGTIILIN